MREDIQRARLIRLKLVAGGLMGCMALAWGASRHWSAAHPWLGYVAAFAEAALIGGLADWFAVTALFRHPLGIPIPHTAIIAANKDRVGKGIATFLQHNFMTHDVLRQELARIDFAGGWALWLDKPGNARALAEQLGQALPVLMAMAEDDEVDRFLRQLFSGSLQDVRFAPVLSRVLEALVAGGQHHVLLQRLLGLVARAFDQQRPHIRQKVYETSPRWMPKTLDDKFFERIVEGVEAFLLELQAEDSPWRARFEAATHELIEQLASSEHYERQLRQMVSSSLGNARSRAYLRDLWGGLRDGIVADLATPHSRVTAKLEELLGASSLALGRAPAIRARLNGWLRQMIADAIVARRDVLGAVIERVIDAWDAPTIARRFELYVGADLQYIRFNGTLVGGAIGLLLFALAG
ncbi:MAG TPA: DUF445 domain-containing protein [Duganella sp.]|nr:DUF445 domain-containing protein [Duganella sp.]